jgi:Flp pilus assembly protein protease CpaA
MVVRIRLGKRPKPAAKRARNRRFAQGVAALLKPAALMALALGIWAIGADFKLTSTFAIASGWLSHWLVWLAVAVILEFCSIALNRYGQNQAPAKTLRTGPAHRAGRSERAAAGLP